MINFIKPYDPAWKTTFEQLKNVLATELHDLDLNIQHVGSTAVPGLCAKPILDIDIIISNETLLNEVMARLEKAGYISKGEQGIAGRFAFKQSSEFTPATATQQQWQQHHLYVCFANSLALKNHLRFRDALLQDKQLVEKYAELKMALVKEKDMTRELYTKRKTEFIVSVLSTVGFDKEELNEIINENL